MTLRQPGSLWRGIMQPADLTLAHGLEAAEARARTDIPPLVIPRGER